MADECKAAVQSQHRISISIDKSDYYIDVFTFYDANLLAFAQACCDWQKEKDAQICKDVVDHFTERDGGKWPEQKDDASQGAEYCADAIRNTKDTESDIDQATRKA